jgi:hypothetical protein
VARLGHFKNDAKRDDFLRRYDDVLRLWPVSAEELDIETEYVPTHVRRSGTATGSAIVLLHPTYGTSLAWFRLVDAILGFVERHERPATPPAG